MNDELKIGIMGGTFDPIHNGHLIIAETVRENLRLDKVLFIPCSIQPNKLSSAITEGHHRLEMVKLAVAGNSGFEASDIEINREGITYSIDTLNELSKLYGKGSELVFIIGADTVWELVKWKSFEKVFKLCSFAAVPRPGYGNARMKKRIEALIKSYGANIMLTESPSIDISSTDIRKRFASGVSARYLVPDSVLDYINDNRLYINAY
jgi:nicotinate-nucleotide adenylyltransferase